jgi:hypothetical protein
MMPIAAVNSGKKPIILACGNQAEDSVHQLLWQCAPMIGSWNKILLKAYLIKGCLQKEMQEDEKALDLFL